MNLLRIIDAGEGNVRVAWRKENRERHYADALPFANPLALRDRQELRWYLEGYLSGSPYGGDRLRASKVEDQMEAWGASLFEQIFPKGEHDPDPRGFYQDAVRTGLEQCELCISSDDSDFLNVPWELIRDPAPGRGFLAPSLAGLYRERAKHAIQADAALSPGPFRILLVIARPGGERDIAIGTIARPILEALRPLGGRVHLEVLRPPTLDALESRLNQSPGAYHLVHFDGHGVFRLDEGLGYLIFERDGGGRHPVGSDELGQMLAACHVPLFVLNACQSAEEGAKDPFASVASRLVAVGAKGVVAMSYSVYADAAALFMDRFYERLVAQDSLSKAVAAGRRRLLGEPRRDSKAGMRELRDWIVPALYQQETGYVPLMGAASAAEPEEGTLEPVETARWQRVAASCPEGRYGFIGRDNDILHIERAFRDDNAPWALLSGLGGTGKTELAYGFARWFAETDGCPGGVFVASLEKGDFGQVVGSIAGFGTDRSRLSEEQQRDILIRYLSGNRCLLVWDNFETVNGYPHGTAPFASDEERRKFSAFLQALRGGKSRVLITSRKPDENWLGVNLALVPLRGLSESDALRLARSILRTVGKTPEHFADDPDYARLLGLLKGHPRSMEVVLPLLRDQSPAHIIDELQHRIGLGNAIEDASLAYAFSQMSDAARKHLPFVGLFTSYVDADTLGVFIASDDEPGKIYRRLTGEAPDAETWERVLDEAARDGMVAALGNRVYELHPTFPTFLRAQLVASVGDGGADALDEAYAHSYAAWSSAAYEHVRRGDRNAIDAVHIEETNLLRALRLGERREDWALAQKIAQTLSEFYDVRQRTSEWRSLRNRLLDWTGREMAAGADSDRADLWKFLLGSEANDALARNDLDAAESAHQRILSYLLSLGSPDTEPHIAVAYHQLGIIAQERQRFDQAEAWYRKALEIFERLGLKRDAADAYHNLGMVVQERQRFDEAEAWYRKALEIFERLGLERDAADDYHQLGIIAEERQRFDEAEAWYRKALEIF
ncbi:tetratricopeptide repeat protein, partial [Candidatus Poribacteria bacterium]|nr:tetratricopeptide repeat protein [Candidatus Poribacteria bacterium]